MKKYWLLLLCLSIGILASASIASATYDSVIDGISDNYAVPGTGINNSVHDLRSSAHFQVNYGYADTLTRICIVCHTPHHAYRLNVAAWGTDGTNGSGPEAPAAFSYLPLWNHATTTQIFTPYENGPDEPTTGNKRSQAIDNGMTIGASSLLCLSCHDGTVAVNVYGNASQPASSRGTSNIMVDSKYTIGQGAYLGNHHPIGFDYSAVQALDSEIAPTATTFDQNSANSRWKNAAAVAAGPSISSLLWNGKMECSTCHMVHNKGNTGERLLVRSDKNSGLCLTCHLKGTIE